MAITVVAHTAESLGTALVSGAYPAGVTGANIKAGDYHVIVLRAASTVTPVISPVWTIGYNAVLQGARLIFIYRRIEATGTESPSDFGFNVEFTNGSSRVNLHRAILRGVHPTTPMSVAPTTGGGTASSSTFSAPSIFANDAGALLMSFVAGSYTTGADTRTSTAFTPAMNSEVYRPGSQAQDYISRMGFEIRPATGATGTRSTTINSAGTNRQGLSVAWRPDPAYVEPPALSAGSAASYYDTTAVKAAVDAAATFADVRVALAPIINAYATHFSFIESSSTTFGSSNQYHGDTFDITDPDFKPRLKILLDEVAKYPPSFFSAINVEQFILVKNLVNTSEVGNDLGGVTTSGGSIFVDFMGTARAVIPQQNLDDGVGGFTFILHHEFAHAIRNTYSGDVGTIPSEWNSANPPGFVYDPANEDDPFAGEHPVAFTRPYAQVSFSEDFSEIWAFIMSSMGDWKLSEWLPADSGMTTKVNYTKDLIATKSVVMSTEAYYDGIHSTFTPPMGLVRYFDTSAIMAAIDAATTMGELESALDPLNAAYSTIFWILEEGGNFYGDYVADPILISDPKIKPAVRTMVDEIAKYPPTFFADLDLSQMVIVKNLLRDPPILSDYGGISTQDGRIFLDMDGAASFSNPQQGIDDGVAGLTFILHHELGHTIQNTWPEMGSEFTEWTDNNPTGFVYGSAAVNEDYEGYHPTTFTRPYARTSYREDMADVWGFRMSSLGSWRLEQWMVKDLRLAAKVQIVEDFIATKSATMSGDAYYSGIHSNFVAPELPPGYWVEVARNIATNPRAQTLAGGVPVGFAADGTNIQITSADGDFFNTDLVARYTRSTTASASYRMAASSPQTTFTPGQLYTVMYSGMVTNRPNAKSFAAYMRPNVASSTGQISMGLAVVSVDDVSHIRQSFTPTGTTYGLTLTSAGDVGELVDFGRIGYFLGDYQGVWFDGDSDSSEGDYVRFRWLGDENASESVMEQFVPTEIEEDAAGGITLGGSAPRTIVFAEVLTASGGVVLSGSAAVTSRVTRTAAGGITLGGSPAPTSRYPRTAAGSLTLGGTASAFTTQARTASGSMALGGSTAQALSAVRTATGTIALGGSAPVTLSAARAASGSMVLEGSADVALSAVRTATDSLTLGGTATAVATVALTASGGLVLGGSADGAAGATRTAAGSIALGGTAGVAIRSVQTTTGGFTLGGSAPRSARATRTAAGSITISGTAARDVTATRIATGGVTLSGSTDIDAAVFRTATGSISLDGSATSAIRVVANAGPAWGETRRNFVLSPRGSVFLATLSSPRISTGRWYGGGSGTGAYEIITDTDGPETTAGQLGTYVRKRWTVSGNTNGDTGFNMSSGGGATTSTTGVPVVAGETYTTSAYFRVNSGATKGKGHWRLWFHNAAGTYLSQVLQATSTPEIPVGVWVRHHLTFTVPEGGAFVTVVWDPSGGASTLPIWQPGESLDVTGYLFERNATLGDYLDGDVAPLGGRARWLGIAGQSASVLEVIESGSGLTLGGTAMQGAEAIATGGVTLGGSAAVSISVARTASGSLALGGTAGRALSSTRTAAGGVTLAGTAPRTWQLIRTGSGGMTLSGTAARTVAIATTATGGIALGGTADVDGGVVERTASGSITLSGTATTAIRTTASGSVNLGGSGAMALRDVEDAAGGITLSGSTLVVSRLVRTASDGITLDGVGATSGSLTRTAAGTIVLSGSATSTARIVRTGDGGLTLDGDATQVVRASRTAAGSVILGGSATAVARAVVAATGGVILGGTAPTVHRVLRTAAGGLTLGGVGSLTVGQVRTAEGFITLGGTAFVGKIIPIPAILTACATTTALVVRSGTIELTACATNEALRVRPTTRALTAEETSTPLNVKVKK